MSDFDEMMEIAPKNLSPLEATIERKVCDYAETKGLVQYKFTSLAHRSVPDRLFFAPGGKVFLIEFKRPGKKPTGGQTREIERLRGMGVTVEVIDNVPDGIIFINRMLEERQ